MGQECREGQKASERAVTWEVAVDNSGVTPKALRSKQRGSEGRGRELGPLMGAGAQPGSSQLQGRILHSVCGKEKESSRNPAPSRKKRLVRSQPPHPVTTEM